MKKDTTFDVKWQCRGETYWRWMRCLKVVGFILIVVAPLAVFAAAYVVIIAANAGATFAQAYDGVFPSPTAGDWVFAVIVGAVTAAFTFYLMVGEFVGSYDDEPASAKILEELAIKTQRIGNVEQQYRGNIMDVVKRAEQAMPLCAGDARLLLDAIITWRCAVRCAVNDKNAMIKEQQQREAAARSFTTQVHRLACRS